MKLNLSLFALTLSLMVSSVSFAGDVFKTVGKFSVGKYQPESSPLKFDYDIGYYIPKALSGKTNLKTLVFLHGGGSSTSTRSTSLDIVKMYSDDLIKIADKLGVVLIMPSGSGLNWGLHMISFLKDLNKLIRRELAVDPNAIGITGHSMGAMGITRGVHWLTDEYSYFLPVAGGLEDKYAIEEYLQTYFNTNYLHLQGKRDHFDIFVTRSITQQKLVSDLEVKYGRKSGYSLELYEGEHNYPLDLYTERLKTLTATKIRNLYQADLRGVVMSINEVVADSGSNDFEHYKGPRNRYFWLEAKEFVVEKKNVNLVANVTENKITVEAGAGLKTLRVFLSSKLVDLTKEVTITVNGVEAFKGVADLTKDMTSYVKQDPGYVFESFVDVTL